MMRRRLILALAIWAGFEMVCLLGSRAHAGVSATTNKEWLRVQITTCADVRTVVAAVGEARAEAVARAAGVSEAQIARRSGA
jgi:hypothetical protein